MDIKALIFASLAVTAGGLVVYIIRDVPKQIFEWAKRKMLYTVTIYQQDELFDIIESWFFNNYRNRYNDVEASVGYIESPGQVAQRELRFKQEESFFVARLDGKKILVSKSKEKLDKAVSLRDIYYRKYVITGFRAKKEVNALLHSIVEEHNKKIKSDSLKVYTNNDYGEWMCVHDVSVKPFSNVIINSQMKGDLIKDIDNFVESKEWYKKRYIRHKRCYGFYGAPGNGKTTIGMAIADHLKRDIYSLNLNALKDDAALIRSFSSIGRSVVLIVEDIDRAFAKRENVDSKISFSSVLNCFDGALCKDGIVTVITTNHLDKLDEALLREGRMDVKYEIKNPSSTEVKQYLELFYDIKISTEIEGDIYSMSYVQEYCIRNKDNSLAAINHFSKKMALAVNT